MALAGLLLLAGCDRGGSPSREDFIGRANEICRETSGWAGEVRPPEGTAAEDPAAWLEPLDDVIRLYEEALERLRALPPPEADRSDVQGALAEIDVVIDALERARDAAAAGDLDAMRAAVAEAGRLGDRSGAFFRSSGALECAPAVSPGA
jgi:hypothetical protein